MPHRKVSRQNILHILIPSGIGIFHPDQFHIMCFADRLFLPVPCLHRFLFKMLFSVQLDHKDRIFPVSALFVYYEIKPS